MNSLRLTPTRYRINVLVTSVIAIPLIEDMTKTCLETAGVEGLSICWRHECVNILETARSLKDKPCWQQHASAENTCHMLCCYKHI